MSAARVFLITGATGVVGSAIVPLLLAEQGTRVHVLLRAASQEALRKRMNELVAFWADSVSPSDIERLFPMRGDVGQPRLGLCDSDHEALCETVTNVVHAAGVVKLNQSIEQSRASNVASVMEVVRFVRSCGASRPFPKVEHLSTVGIAGRHSRSLAEERFSSDRGYHNSYEQAKSEAETVLLSEIDAGLPFTLHRPSMVVGDSRDGRIAHFQVFYRLIRFIAGSRTHGWLPRFRDAKLDLVPVDYVAAAIVASSRRRDAVGRIFHLCSGPQAALPLTQIGVRLRGFLADRGEKVWRPRFLPLATMRSAIKAAAFVTGGRTRRALQSLPHFLDYLDEAQTFENRRTLEFFRSERLAPAPADDFLLPVLRYWYDHASE